MYNKYNSKSVDDQNYQPDYTDAFQSGVNDFQKSSNSDNPRTLLWIIDAQCDFVYPTGRLAVSGAVDDTRRTIEFLYRNVDSISQIACSLDTHVPFQIFFGSWWYSEKTGKNPPPFTIITKNDVHNGTWTPIIEPSQSLQYLEELEKSGKKQLCIWPPHCYEGSSGRSLVPALSEAISYHSGRRMTQPDYIAKGTISNTEYYSVVEPEVKSSKHPDGGKNVAFLKNIANFDRIYIAGQARSHCVLETVNSVMKHYANRADVLQKLYFLDDCTSSISGFETETENTIRDFVSKGMILVNSTDAI